MICAGIRVI